MIPGWLHGLAWFWVGVCLLCALWFCGRLLRAPEKMTVMNWVWPLLALSGGPLVVWLYHRHRAYPQGKAPFAVMTAVATCHCGAGCTLGDLIAETLAFLVPGILVAFGLDSLFTGKLPATWLLDFVVAYLLGIVFQFFSIVPMRHLNLPQGLVAALKADTLSIAAWQIGMYGLMAAVQFGLMRLAVDRIEFWFAMQMAMLAGFAVSYPVNAWLLKSGIKEKM